MTPDERARLERLERMMLCVTVNEVVHNAVVVALRTSDGVAEFYADEGALLTQVDNDARRSDPPPAAPDAGDPATTTGVRRDG